jgi:hypothetical protein
MKNFPIPVGTVKYFEGDITAVEDKPFGIFEVEVNTPKILNFLLLNTKLKTESGIRTISNPSPYNTLCPVRGRERCKPYPPYPVSPSNTQ